MALVIGTGITVGTGITISSDVTFVNPSLDIGSAVSVEAVSPFGGGGNSYLFSSSINSYIDTAGSSDWAVGTGDFTIEWFQRQTSTDSFQRAFTVDDFPTAAVAVSIEDATFYYWAASGFRYSSAAATTINTWYHWAVVRASGTTTVYRNAIVRGAPFSDTNNITNTTDPLTIGNENDASAEGAFRGYITNFRWIKGLAVYSGTATDEANFTVPTSSLTATAGANPYGGSNTAAIPAGVTRLLLVP